MFRTMTRIYKNKKFSDEQKWIEWWKLFSTGEQQVPDGRHHDTISISLANIPDIQQMFQNMWNKNVLTGFLPSLDDFQIQIVYGLLRSVILAYPTIEKHRRKRTQPQTPEVPSVGETTPLVAFASGPSPSFNDFFQGNNSSQWSQPVSAGPSLDPNDDNYIYRDMLTGGDV